MKLEQDIIISNGGALYDKNESPDNPACSEESLNQLRTRRLNRTIDNPVTNKCQKQQLFQLRKPSDLN
jgi:hypothetical protein